MWEAIALAVGLAMDATAVAAARGLARGRSHEAWSLPLLFGAFQAGMAALGWILGRWAGPYIEAWDHWLAFGLLVAIGGKMLVEGWRRDGGAEPRAGVLVYLGLALATSIDAAAAGVTLPLLAVAPGVALAWIGGVTLTCTALGHAVGRRVGRRFGPRLEIVGGLVLIGIGTRILVPHL